MKFINPLYILLTLMVVVITLVINLNVISSESKSLQSAIESKSKIASSVVSLKREWDNRSKSKNELNTLLNSNQLRDVLFKVDRGSSIYSITTKSMNKDELNYLLNRVLNSALVVKTLRIKSMSKYSASLILKVEL
ncbi:MAG: hypothetical protein GQ570_10040 [Helicobacteraceae bacterium]|nr:hypothetical protein [Helicobacteraceae bacterium]